MSPPETFTLRLGDAELSIRLEGTGPPLLLIHGLTASRAVWRRVSPLLRERYSLILPDLAGRGAAPPEEDVRYRLVDEADRLTSLLDALDRSPAAVVGHSQGAALALALCALRPGIHRVALINPVSPWTPRPLLLSLLGSGPVTRAVAGAVVPRISRPAVRWILERRVFTGRGRPDQATVEAFARPYGSSGRARALVRILADWNPSRLRGYLPAAPLEAVVVAGAEDRRIPPAEAARLARRLDAGLRVVEGAGHAVPLERPSAVAAAVERLPGRAGVDGGQGTSRQSTTSREGEESE
jgi:magnesium chelatase accessory protein